MKKLLYLLFALPLLAGKCNKDDNTPATPLTFQPVTANSTWSYESKNLKTNTVTGSYTLKATTKDSLINGKTYKVFTNSGGPNNYYAQVGTDYYQLASLEGTTQQIELLYLKDAALNTTWTEAKTINFAGVPVPVNATLNYTIQEKGISYTVGSSSFSDVTHVKITLSGINVSGLPITPTVNVIDYYFARKVGRIYSHTRFAATALAASVDIDEETKITSYTIAP